METNSMTIKLSSFIAGGSFLSKFFSGSLTETTGSITGDVLTLTPPAGQRVRLTSLAADDVSLTKSGTSVTVGATTVVNNLTLQATNTSADGNFIVSGSANVNPNVSSGFIDSITGNIDEDIIINISVSSAGDIVYSYQFGV